MFELNKLTERTYYINCPAKIGLYKPNDTDVYLIDSGNDKDAGRKVKKILNENNWNLKGIINTHSNADHIGGNRYLQQQYGCKVFSGGIEAAFIQYPVLEPSFLYGGYPCKDLRHKFLMAQESSVTDISDSQFPKELEVIPLYGHFFDMIGIRTPDEVVFLADCISSADALDKYQISFIYDVKSYLTTLDKVQSMSAEFFVPAHADVSKDVSDLAELNRQKVFEISESIKKLLKTPMCFDSLLKEIFDMYKLSMNFEQYVLVGSTVRSYLSWLKDDEKVDISFEENKPLWRSL